MLSREQILGYRPPQETVFVPELQDSVIVRGMTSDERDIWEVQIAEASAAKGLEGIHVRARAVVMCTVDDKGVRLFTEADIEPLGQTAASMTNRLYRVAMTLSAVGPGAVAQEKKDSASSPSGSSPSA